MVTIISKGDGPYKEDAAAKRLIQDNSAKIHQLANHLTAGGSTSGKIAIR